jgi:RimJ/RimL family protein N-acetyltransferase
MNEAEFDAFMEISVADHIQGQITAGYWQPEEAEENMERLRGLILPQGQATPNQFFYRIQDHENHQVGGLWYMIAERDRKQFIFVIDIQIFEQSRRRGYGTKAFRLMEDQARELGISSIALNVFKNNQPARAMYEKLGYVGEGESMIKEID